MDEFKSKILDDLVGKNPSLLLEILAHIEKEGEKRVVTIADIDILHIWSCHGGACRHMWDIGGIGFTYDKVEAAEYFRVLHESKNSDLCRQIVSKLEFVDKRFSEVKSEVSVEFDISRGKSKYECKISKRYELNSKVLKVFEIYTCEKWWWWDGDKRNELIALEIIGGVFDDEIKKEVRNKLGVEFLRRVRKELDIDKEEFVKK
jgi:hypothetical protein